MSLSDPVINFLFSLLLYVSVIFLIIFVPVKLFKKKKATREALGLKDLPTWTDIIFAGVGFIAYFVVATLVTYFLTYVLRLNLSESQNLGVSSTLYFPYERIFTFLNLCVLAPLAEEFIFRGWLYGLLRAKIPGKLSLPLSVFAVSLLFAVLHFQLNVGINVFVMSVVLCLMREVTGTIYSGTIVHMLKNAIAFFLVFLV